MISAAGDATLSHSDPGHLTNGAFSLAEPLLIELAKSTRTGPTSNEKVAITLLGTALTEVIQTGLTVLQVGLDSLNIYLGLILLLAIATERVRTAVSGAAGGDAASGAVAAQMGAGGRARRFLGSNVATLAAIVVCGLIFLTATGGHLVTSAGPRNTFLAFLTVPVLIGLAQLVALAVGQMNLAVGALNGIVVVLTRVSGFVVTLATMTILLGLQYRVIGTHTVGGYSPALKSSAMPRSRASR